MRTRETMRIVKQWAIAGLVGVMLLPGCGPGPDALSKSGQKGSEDAADSGSVEDGGQKEVRVKAEAGVGKRGQKLKKHDGLYSTPLKVLLNTQQKLAFMNVDRAMQLFHASKGRYPDSHDEYMREIIKANMIALPELPEGERYEYDPDTHELMVLRPVKLP